MNNPQYIEYLNTFGAEIDVGPQPSREEGTLPKKNIYKDKEFPFFSQLFIETIHHTSCKYYQFCNLIKHFLLDEDEEVRQRLIDSIEKLKDKEYIKREFYTF